MKGRKPIPTTMHVLNGNPGKRKLPETVEDKYTNGSPDPVKELSEEARAEWDRIVPELEVVGVLKKVDRAALAMYCTVWAQWLEAQKKMIEEGTFMRSPDGYLVMNPYFKIAERCVNQIKSFLSEFGMTPAARVRIRPGAPKEEDNPFLGWLNGEKKERA